MAELTGRPGLAAFLSETAARPFRWGVTDCLLRPADWVRAVRGVDPAAPWRGRYHTAYGASRLLRDAGGLEALFAEAAAAAGLERTDAPQAGDVGIVRGGEDLFGAVRTGRGWMLKTAAGVWVADLPLVRAWRV